MALDALSIDPGALRPRVKKAELIEGTVYVGSPVRNTYHGRPHLRAAGWLMHHRTGFSKSVNFRNADSRLSLHTLWP